MMSNDVFVAYIDNVNDLAEMLKIIPKLSTSPPSLYVDLEGASLSRHGSISPITFFIRTISTVYLIDVHRLGASAFSTPAAILQVPNNTPTTQQDNNNTLKNTKNIPPPPLVTLKSILESPTIPKVFFDVRNDSDALFSLHGISLQCIHDVQLLELALTSRASRQYVVGLAKCIDWNIAMTDDEAECILSIKEAGNKLFSPAAGGSYERFNDRPLLPLIEQYCVLDVQHLPYLWGKFTERLDAFWTVMVREATEARVRESQSVAYRPIGEHKKLGCWSGEQIEEARRRWELGRRSGLVEY